jgi:hypothetical protein
MPTATLRVSAGPSSGRSIACHRGRYALGRASTSALRIEDPAVHWEHCVIEAAEDALWIENRAAAGTKLAGKPIRARTRLRHGDTIRLSPRSEVTVDAPDFARSRMPSIAAIVTVLLLAAAALWFASRPPSPEGPSSHQVRSALIALHARLAEREHTEPTLQGLTATLQHALRLDAAGDAPAARRHYRDAWVVASARLSPMPALSLRESLALLNAPPSAPRPTSDQLLAAVTSLARFQHARLAPPSKPNTTRFKP